MASVLELARARGQSRKVLSSPPAETPKLQGHTGQPSLRVTEDWQTVYKQRRKEKTNLRRAGGAETWSSLSPHLQRGNSQVGEPSQLRKPPEKRVLWAPHQVPSLGKLAGLLPRTETRLLKDSCANSPIPRPRSEAKAYTVPGPYEDRWANFRACAEGQGSGGTFSEDGSNGVTSFFYSPST